MLWRVAFAACCFWRPRTLGSRCGRSSVLLVPWPPPSQRAPTRVTAAAPIFQVSLLPPPSPIYQPHPQRLAPPLATNPDFPGIRRRSVNLAPFPPDPGPAPSIGSIGPSVALALLAPSRLSLLCSPAPLPIFYSGVSRLIHLPSPGPDPPPSGSFPDLGSVRTDRGLHRPLLTAVLHLASLPARYTPLDLLNCTGIRYVVESLSWPQSARSIVAPRKSISRRHYDYSAATMYISPRPCHRG